MNSIVVARHNEDLQWIVNIPDNFEIFIYNKGAEIVEPAVLAKAHHIFHRVNVGREAETYLYHMQLSQRSDADYTVFTQGNPFEHSPDFLEILERWEQWSDLQPLTWQRRIDANIPPLDVLLNRERDLAGRSRIRPERFSLSTWSPLDFIDVEAQHTGTDYRISHGRLPEGTNIASHFFRGCGLTELAQEASEYETGVFCYGSSFAVRNHLISKLSSDTLGYIRELIKGSQAYGRILERLWLHLFGAEFQLRRVSCPQENTALARGVTIPAWPL